MEGVNKNVDRGYDQKKNKDRDAIQSKIDAEIGEPTEYSVYTSMVVPK
jgi:hypothetical protein